MSTLSILPLYWDIGYVLKKLEAAGVTNHYGYDELEDGFHLRYRAVDFDTVQGVLDAYQTSYADEVLREQMLAGATFIRWQKQQETTFAGKPLPADDQTIARITAAIVLMQAVPTSAQTRRWKTGPNADDWITVDLTALLAMGAQIANHVQGCFDHEENLHTAIRAAATVDELRAIDVTVGWPE